MEEGTHLTQEEDGREARRRFSRIGTAYFGLLLAAMAAQFIVVIAIGLLAYRWPGLVKTGWVLLAAALLPIYAVGVPVCALLFRRVPAQKPVAQPMRASCFLRFLLIGVSIMYLGSLVGGALMGIVGAVRGSPVENNVDALLQNVNLVVVMLATVLVAPFFEELLFRRMLLDRIRQYGEGLSIVLSGVLFGLFHGNFYQFFYAAGAGMLLAYVYLRTGQLSWSVALHMALNLVGGVLAPGVTTLAADLPGATGLTLVALFGFALLACVVTGIVLFVRNWKNRVILPATHPLPPGRRLRIVAGNAGMILFALAVLLMFLINLAIS